METLAEMENLQPALENRGSAGNANGRFICETVIVCGGALVRNADGPGKLSADKGCAGSGVHKGCGLGCLHMHRQQDAVAALGCQLGQALTGS
jgi:hypothetical protein